MPSPRTAEIDEMAAGYRLPEPGGPWLPALLEVYRQSRALMLRHGWLPELLLTRSTLGPHATDLLEHVLAVLADHPADAGRKLEAFAVMTTLTAALTLNELNAGSGPGRAASYLAHAVAAGRHPHLTAALTGLGVLLASTVLATRCKFCAGSSSSANLA